MRTVREYSAGGVIYRPGSGSPGTEPEVCLIATEGFRHWQLPKGLVESGEPPEETATREVREETGLEGEIDGFLGRIEYWYVRPDYRNTGERVRVHKEVDFFLMRYVSGSTDLHDHEVDDARWFPVSEALRTLSFDSEREILRKARARIAGTRDPA